MLSQAMIHSLDPSNIIKQVYGETVIESVDIEDIKSILAEMTLEKCKLVFLGNDLLKNSELLTEPISKQQKEPHFKTNFRIYKKPENLKELFQPKEWEDAIKSMKKPTKNRFVPDDISIIPCEKKQRNDSPDEI